MNTELLLSDKRFRWISTMYFYVTANAENAINPFKNLVDFLEVKVGDLFWGKDEDSQISTKYRICGDFQKIMKLHGYYISEEELLKCLSDDKLSNESFAQRLSMMAKSI
jgi:hypothetical protein